MTLPLTSSSLCTEPIPQRHPSVTYKLVRIRDPNLARSVGVNKDRATPNERRMTLNELSFASGFKRPAHKQSPHFRSSELSSSCADRMQARISWRSSMDCKESAETCGSSRDTIASSDSSVRRDDSERDDGGSSLLAHGEMMNQQLESLESVVSEIGACLRVEECRIASLKDDIVKELSALKATVTELRSQGATILLCHISNPISENLQPFRKAIIHAQIVSIKIDRLINRAVKVL
uniref:AlNc14C94G5793 protein n=1 Tax=Albugo laibachii Nc14 TaxID=890382 RepID=F0WGR6_9STRA|nr:AlNc14C94G5793 [Albugo laibachii Nc14]|eukprot:CCA20430.1 AlNc14C94G5793 [Albugo laibachii Nc14]